MKVIRSHWFGCLSCFLLIGSALPIYSQQQSLSEELKNLSNKIELLAKNESDSLSIYVERGIELAKAEGQNQLIIRFKHLLGVKAFKNADYKSSAENYLSAIKVAESTKANKEYVHLLFDASELYRRIDKDTSMNFIRKGLKLAESMKLSGLIADGYNRLGYAFEIRERNDSAYHYYKKGLDLNLKINDKLGTSYAYESLAGILNKQNKSSAALGYLKKSYQIRKSLKDDFSLAISLINIGETFLKLQQKDSAIFYGKQAKELATKIKFFDLQAYCNNFLATIYKEKGDFKTAMGFMDEFVSIKDSLFNIEKTKQLTELDKKYQTEKKVQQIKLLEQKALIHNLELRERNYWLIFLVVFIIVATIITFFVFNRRKLKAKAELQAAVIKQQDIASKAVLEAEERERRRIAGDLHDGVGQMLSAALMNFNSLLSKVKLIGQEQIQAEKTLALLSESYDEMRTVSHQMMPNALIKSGLAVAIKEFISKLNQDKLKVMLELSGLHKRLDDQVETVIYRVVQESVNNVVKHAEATSLFIQIVSDEEGVDITIEDNGKGFDKTVKKPNSGIGLGNIYSRVTFLKGTVDIDTKPGNGTLIAIHIPV